MVFSCNDDGVEVSLWGDNSINIDDHEMCAPPSEDEQPENDSAYTKNNDEAENNNCKTRKKIAFSIIATGIIVAVAIIAVIYSPSSSSSSAPYKLAQPEDYIDCPNENCMNELLAISYTKKRSTGYDTSPVVVATTNYNGESSTTVQEQEQVDLPIVEGEEQVMVMNAKEEEEEHNITNIDGINTEDDHPPAPIEEFIATTKTMRTSVSVTNCKSNEVKCQFALKTDLYSWETSWSITGRNNNMVYAAGPPAQSKYARTTSYFGFICLPKGQRYRLQMNDLMGDGLCCNHGKGAVSLKVNNKVVIQSQETDDRWKVKLYNFNTITPSPPVVPQPPPPTPRPTQRPIPDINTPINNGKECSIVNPINYNIKFTNGASEYPGFPGSPCYRTVEGTKQTVSDLLDKYPTLTKRVVLNDYVTAESNERLYVLVLSNKRFVPSNGEGKSQMLVISSIHPNELTPAETMLRFAEYMLENQDKDPDVKWILDYTEIHLIIHANPDGRLYYERNGKAHRKNRNNDQNCQVPGSDSGGNVLFEGFGVDLNRNFPFMWGTCPASERCSKGECNLPLYRGPKKQSEQETKAILQYAYSIFPGSNRKASNMKQSEALKDQAFSLTNTGVFIDVHSFGNDVGWPWGHSDTKTPNDVSLGALGRKQASYGEQNLYAPTLPNRHYSWDGGTIDTMYGHLGVASFFYELGTKFVEACSEYPKIINDTFPGLLYTAKVARTPYITGKGPDILCTTIKSLSRNGQRFINVQVSVSDNARVQNDDDPSLFQTGRQSIRRVDIYLCHPYQASSCSPVTTKSTPNAGSSTTVSLEFQAPTGRQKKVMYIRARDSSNIYGPITARDFV